MEVIEGKLIARSPFEKVGIMESWNIGMMVNRNLRDSERLEPRSHGTAEVGDPHLIDVVGSVNDSFPGPESEIDVLNFLMTGFLSVPEG